MYGNYGVTIDTINHFNIVRGGTGGLFIGFSLLFILGGLNKSYTRASLISLFVFMTSFALGRLVSMLVDGIPTRPINIVLVIEIILALLAGYALLMENKHEKS